MKYNISMKENAYLCITVDAENLKEAKQIALRKAIDSNEWESNGIEIISVSKDYGGNETCGE